MLLKVGPIDKPVAVVSLYGPPHQGLLEASSHTYWTVSHLRTHGTRVIDIKIINSVVMMAPDQQYSKTFQDGSQNDRWYLMEKPGLKLSASVGVEEVIVEE